MASKAFLDQLKAGVNRLNGETHQPMILKGSPFNYYFSSMDQAMTFSQAETWCSNFNGHLLRATGPHELEYLKKRMLEFVNNIDDEVYWYGENPYSLDFKLEGQKADGDTSCQQFSPATGLLTTAACSKKLPFICRNLVIPDPATLLQDEVVTFNGEFVPYTSKAWIYILVILLVLLVVGAGVFMKLRKDKKQINITKLPTATPIGSPRGGAAETAGDDTGNSKSKQKK